MSNARKLGRIAIQLACLVLTAKVWLIGDPAAAGERSQPNVVLIIVDTLRADKLGCYGFPDKEISPELDALAGKGVQFMRTVAQCSWTRPSVASMITSRYPRSLGISTGYNETLGDRFTTISEVLRANGYYTIGITTNPHLNSYVNMNQGFDTYTDSAVVFEDMAAYLSESSGAQMRNRCKMMPAQKAFEIAEQEIAAKEDKPYYLQVLIVDVHEYARLNKSLTRKEYGDLFEKVPNRSYLQAVRQASADIGAFVKRLTALPGGENTLFVITADHGEGLWDHPHVPKSSTHGWLLYESQIMVPMIWYHPAGELPSHKVERPIRLLELMPTLLEYLALPIPDDVDGMSVLPLLQHADANVSLPDAFVLETHFIDRNKMAIYTGDWKYFENRDSSPWLNPRELQPTGIKEDGKHTDAIEQHPEVADRLQKFLAAWEEQHPTAKPTRRKTDPSRDEMDQMKTLGYVD